MLLQTDSGGAPNKCRRPRRGPRAQGLRHFHRRGPARQREAERGRESGGVDSEAQNWRRDPAQGKVLQPHDPKATVPPRRPLSEIGRAHV